LLAIIDTALQEFRATLKTKEERTDHLKHSGEPEEASN
jgi:hypothetical protein